MQVRRCVFLVNAPVAILASPTVAVISPKVRDSGIQKSGLWNPKYSKKKKKTHTHTKKQAKKNSGIPLKIGIQNPSSTETDWNPVPEIRNHDGAKSRLQDCLGFPCMGPGIVA